MEMSFEAVAALPLTLMGHVPEDPDPPGCGGVYPSAPVTSLEPKATAPDRPKTDVTGAAGKLIAAVPTAVTCPLALVVITGTEVALPAVPVLPLTVGRVAVMETLPLPSKLVLPETSPVIAIVTADFSFEACAATML